MFAFFYFAKKGMNIHMANDINIVIAAKLNEIQSTANINKQKKQLEASLNKTPIQMQIEVNSGLAMQEMSKAAKSYQQVWEKAFYNQKQSAIKNANEIKNAYNSQLFVNFDKSIGIGQTTGITKQNSALAELFEKSNKSTTGLSDLEKQTVKLNPAMKELGNATEKSGQSFGNILQKISLWAIATTAVYAPLRALQESITFVEDMSKLFTNLQMEMTDTNLVFSEITNTANEYATAMGTTTESVMKAISVFGTYVSTMDEIMKKSQAAIILANLTGQSIETTSDDLMGILSQFDLQAEDSMHVADVIAGTARLLQIDYPIAVDTIAKGMRTVGSVAKESKVPIELLASMIGTLSEKTRRSGTELANALRTIFGRILNVGEDADPEAFKKIEKEFNALGISIRELNGDGQTLRPVGDILKDLAAQWNNLSDAQKQQLAFDSAGMYRKNTFIALMNSYNDVLANNEQAINSQGVAEQKQAIYMDSMTAAVQGLQNAWESFYLVITNSDSLKEFIKILTSMVDGFTSLLDTPLTPLITTIAATTISAKGLSLAYSGLSASSLAVTISTNGLIATLANLTKTMLASPLFWVAAGTAAIYGIIKAVDALTVSFEEQQKKVQELSNDIKSLQTEYDTLFAKTDRTDAENKRLELLKAEIEANKVLLKQEYEKQYAMGNAPKIGGTSGKDRYLVTNNTLDAEIKEYKGIDEVTAKSLDQQDEMIARKSELISKFTEEIATLEEYKNAGVELSDADKQRLAQLNAIIYAYNAETTALQASTEAQLEVGSVDNMTSAVSAYVESLKTLEKVESKVADSQSLSYDEKSKLLDQYPQLESAIYRTADGWSVEIGALNKVKETSKETAIAQVKAEKDKTLAALQGAKARIGLLVTEATTQQEFTRALLGNIQGSSQGVVMTDEQKTLQNQFNLFRQLTREAENFNKEIESISAGKISGSSSSSKKEKDPFEELDKQFQDRLALSKQYVEDRNFYDDWGADNEIAAWERVKKYTQEYYAQGKMSAELYAETIREVNKNIYSAQKAVEDSQKEMITTISDAEDEIVKMYEWEKDQKVKKAEDAKDKALKSAKEEYDKKKKFYEDELSNYQKMIQGKLDLIKEQADAEDFQSNLSNLQKELTDYQNQYNTLGLAAGTGDRVAQQQQQDLAKQIADKEEEIQKLVNDRNRSLEENQLNDSLDLYNEYIDNKQTALDKSYQAEQDDIDETYQKKVKRLEEAYSKEELYSKARKALVSGEYDELQTLFEKYHKDQGDGWSDLGSTLQTEFVDKLQRAKDLIEELNGMGISTKKLGNAMNSGSDSGSSSGGSSNKSHTSLGGGFADMSVSDWNIYKQNKAVYEDKDTTADDKAYVASLNASLRKKYGISGDSYSYDDIKGYYASGTTSVPESGLYRVGEKGAENVFLNRGSSVIPADVTRNIMAFGQNPLNYMSGLMSSLTPVSSNNSNMINIESLVTIQGDVTDSAKVNEIKNVTQDALKPLYNYLKQSRTSVGFGW